MRTVALPQTGGEEEFRAAARACLAQGLAPEELVFTTDQQVALFEPAELRDAPAVAMPRRFVSLVSEVACHSAPDRFALLYRLLWRIHSGERDLLERAADPAVIQATRYAQAVRREVYRMHAFVRLAERTIGEEKVFVAWFEPQHDVLRRAAPFFVDRFRSMEWLIATPFRAAAWRHEQLTFAPPPPRPEKADDAVLEELWTAYYRATFNPARLRVRAMQAQMPKRHWPTMPETALVPELVQGAHARVSAMERRAPEPAPRFALALESRASRAPALTPAPLDSLRREAQACALCPLHEPATQTVFGEGPEDAAVVFVGEQPGDQEDLAGRPFVGPAGQIFDRALAAAGVERDRVYVTNAVKHFKFEPRGKRRVHQRPGVAEVRVCSVWLRRELAVVRPKLVVALGATAALGLTGRALAVTRERGRLLESDGLRILPTVHPSYLLRLPDKAAAEQEFAHFVEDLKQVRPWLEKTT